MGGWDLDHSEKEMLDIWLSLSPRNETQTTNPLSSTTISNTTNAIIAYLTAPTGSHATEYDDFNNRSTGLLHALIEFCCLHPRSMDDGIKVLFQVVKNVPHDAISELGEGPEGFRLYLERYFGNFVDPYNTDGSRDPIGTKSTYVYDKSQLSVQFCREEVQECPDEVIKTIRKVRKARWRSMVALCFTARCHVLEEPVHPYNGDMDERLMQFLKMGLDLTRPRWNQVFCIGMMITLRGSAAYLLSTFPIEEQEVRRREWMNSLSILLYTTGEGREIGDKADHFKVKYHATLALKNLGIGGKNESTAELFATDCRMF